MITTPTPAPAPMTAERLYEVREQYRSGRWGDGLPRELFGHIDALTARVAELELERADQEASFDLRWNADRRAIERWRKAGPDRELTLPDYADLCVWLLSLVETLESELAAARKVEDGEVAAYVQKLRDFDVGDTETWIADNWPLEAADLLTRLSAALKEAERENATLAAGQCVISKGGLTNDDYGNQFCAMERRAQAAEAKLEQADEKICQAYQIVGSLAHETNTFDVPAVQRALDYLSGDAFDANFLPWSIRALQTKDTTP